MSVNENTALTRLPQSAKKESVHSALELTVINAFFLVWLSCQRNVFEKVM